MCHEMSQKTADHHGSSSPPPRSRPSTARGTCWHDRPRAQHWTSIAFIKLLVSLSALRACEKIDVERSRPSRPLRENYGILRDLSVLCVQNVVILHSLSALSRASSALIVDRPICNARQAGSPASRRTNAERRLRVVAAEQHQLLGFERSFGVDRQHFLVGAELRRDEICGRGSAP